MWKNEMSARCFFSFDQNNGLFPPEQSHQGGTAPCLTPTLCMHDDIQANQERRNESANVENVMMKMDENDYPDDFFLLLLDTVTATMKS